MSTNIPSDTFNPQSHRTPNGNGLRTTGPLPTQQDIRVLTGCVDELTTAIKALIDLLSDTHSEIEAEMERSDG